MDILAPSLLGAVGVLCGCAFPIAGIVFGLAQWRLLREPKHDLRLWLIANAIGWTLGLFVGSLVFGLIAALGFAQLVLMIVIPIAGGLTGLIASSITGWALTRVLMTPITP